MQNNRLRSSMISFLSFSTYNYRVLKLFVHNFISELRELLNFTIH